MTRLFLLALLLTLGGCVHELKFLPQCDGTPAAQYPCLAPCKVKVYSAAMPTEQLLPNALVIKNHRGEVHCMEVNS